MPSFLPPYQIKDECTVGGGHNITVTDVYFEAKRLVSVSFNWTAGVAPTTAENIVITLDSGQGAEYDVPLITRDPSTFGGGFHKWLWTPEPEISNLVLAAGDHVKVTYTNTDDLGIGVVLTLEAR